ncbi:MAG: hypothetical protein LAP86_03730 [Acidobacteriia bacterium]|nr:hypothetical protein [Terriglobia bacterium]
MSTGSKLKKIAIAVLLSSGLVCAADLAFADAAAQAKPQVHRKSAKKKPVEPPPPLPSGPTGRPVQQMPLDAIAAVPPQVTYENNQLTILAPNSTLADILRAVRKQTGADIEIPAAPERVVTHLGPGPAREVMADLLNGSRFNYVLLGSPSDQSALTRVVLVAKTGPQEITPNPVVAGTPPPENQAVNQPTEPEPAAEANEAESADDNNNADENADQQPAEAEQQAPGDQPQGVKTPQQMLQEMQQRQMQLQQQQRPGQPPVPGSGMPPHPPQEN